MTRNQLQRFTTVLEDSKADLASALQGGLDRLAVSPSADPMDQMLNLKQQNLDSQQISILLTKLRHVEAALQAIGGGTFGTCARCDGSIPLKRLEAVPWSPYCTACQETIEAGTERGASQVTEYGDLFTAPGRRGL